MNPMVWEKMIYYVHMGIDVLHERPSDDALWLMAMTVGQQCKLF